MNLSRFLPRRLNTWLDKNPMRRRLARGAFWTLAGSMAARLLTIPISIILARWMGPSKYGELGVINSSIDLFVVFAGFGLGLTATKHVAELRRSDPERAGRILALSTATAGITAALTAIVFFLMAPYLAAHALNAPHLAGLLRISSLVLFLAAINGAQLGGLFGFEAFRATARIQTIIGLTSLPLTLAGYWLGGLDGIVWSMVACRLVDWLLRRLALISEASQAGVPFRLRGWTKELPVLWRYSVPALLAGILVAPVNWACTAMLVNRPGGYVEMGIFNVANQWYGALLFLPTVLGSGLLPLLSDRLGQKDGHSSLRVVVFMLRMNSLIVLPAVALGALLSPWIMHFYGPAYERGWPTLVVVLLTAGIFAILVPVGDVIAASGRMWAGMAMNGGWAAVFIGSTMLLVHRGAFGLGSARLIAYGAHAIWTVAFAWFLISKAARRTSQQNAIPEAPTAPRTISA